MPYSRRINGPGIMSTATFARSLARPSTQRQIEQFAREQSNSLAAWTVEARTADQVLLADMLGRTKSWLMVAAAGSTASPLTRLYFG